MGRAQELFDRAVKSYNEAIQLLKAMDQSFQEVVFKNQPDKRYDTRITFAQFDMILQAVLLNMAVSDGEFDRLEQQFVEKITDYGDLLTYIKQDSKGQLDLTWAQVANLSPSTQQKLVQMLPAILDNLCDSFVKPLALVDKAIDTVDFMRKLEGYIAEISVFLSYVDGNSDEGEENASCEMVVRLLEKRWKQYMN